MNNSRSYGWHVHIFSFTQEKQQQQNLCQNSDSSHKKNVLKADMLALNLRADLKVALFKFLPSHKQQQQQQKIPPPKDQKMC